MDALKRLGKLFLPFASGDIGGNYWNKENPIYPGNQRLVPCDLINALVVIAETYICQCTDEYCDGECSKCQNHREIVKRSHELLKEPNNDPQ